MVNLDTFTSHMDPMGRHTFSIFQTTGRPEK